MNFALRYRLLSQPWFIGADAHAGLLTASGGSKADIVDALQQLFPQRPPSTLEADTGIAHLSLFGPLARGLSTAERHFGMTDLDTFSAEFASALASGARGVLLHIDSPGGTVAGTPEAAALVAASPVPVVAHARLMASAAYYIGAGARHVVADPSAQVGSIGVITSRLNLATALATAGIKLEVMRNTGADLKAPGAECGDLTAAQTQAIQADLDRLAADFHHHVAAHRTIAPELHRGHTLSGQAAIAANLVDTIGPAAAARAHLLTLLPAPTAG
jgi:ClpP class serine protease